MYQLEEIKDPSFDIPDGYFEQMQQKVASRIHSEQSIQMRRTIFRRIYIGLSSAAAVILIILGIARWNGSYIDMLSSESMEISSVEQLDEYVSHIQEKYSYTSTNDSDVMAETSSITDIYMSFLETSTETQTEEKTEHTTSYTEGYEIGYYNIMELASL